MNISSVDKNILIVGGGRSGRRFVESYLFTQNINMIIAGFDVMNQSRVLAQKYGLEYVNFNQIKDFSKYRIVVLSVPYHLRYSCIIRIKGNKYEGKMIIEKPFAINQEDYFRFMKALDNTVFRVPFSRRYDSQYDLQIKDFIDIKWPVDDYVKVDIFMDLLPHCIDWAVRNINKKIINISVKARNSNYYELLLDDVNVRIEFDTGKRKNVVVNGIAYNWIDTFKVNNRMLEDLLNSDCNDPLFMQDLLYVSRIMEACNG